jgi:hypothetical protein
MLYTNTVSHKRLDIFYTKNVSLKPLDIIADSLIRHIAEFESSDYIFKHGIHLERKIKCIEHVLILFVESSGTRKYRDDSLIDLGLFLKIVMATITIF